MDLGQSAAAQPKHLHSQTVSWLYTVILDSLSQGDMSKYDTSLTLSKQDDVTDTQVLFA